MSKFLLDNSPLIELSKEHEFEKHVDLKLVTTTEVCKKEFIDDFIDKDTSGDMSLKQKNKEMQSRQKLWSALGDTNIIKNNTIDFAEHLQTAFESGVEYSLGAGTGIVDVHIVAIANKCRGKYVYVTNDKKLQKVLTEIGVFCINYNQFKNRVWHM